MKPLISYLQCHSLVCRLAASCAAAIAVLIVGYTILFVMLVQHRTNLDLDHALGEEIAIQVNRAIKEESNTVSANDIKLSVTESKGPVSSAGRVAIDAWVMQRSNPTQVLQQIVKSDSAPALSNSEAVNTDHQGFDIASEGSTWRAMQVQVVSPTAGPMLIRVALPTKSLRMMVQDILYYATWCAPLLLVLAFSIGLILANVACAPMKALIRSARAIRPNRVDQRLVVDERTNEISELCTVINQLLDRVQIALQQQSRFATEVAHELRTPLTALRSVGELALRAKSSDNSLCDSISAMLEEGQHMHKFIDSLLLVAQADSGLLSKNLSPINVTTVIRRCVRTMQPLAEVKSQKLFSSLNTDCIILADEPLLRQILLNLIQNAVRHTPEFSQISVYAAQCSDIVMITVVDNGPGFSKFNRDQLVRKDPRKKFDCYDRGLGLGLSIVQSLVRAQDGKMRVTSHPDRGTTIQLAFKRLVVRKSNPAFLKPVATGSLNMPLSAS
jgi:signal transduction histidine kinase